jgi:hypothetical protein
LEIKKIVIRILVIIGTLTVLGWLASFLLIGGAFLITELSMPDYINLAAVEQVYQDDITLVTARLQKVGSDELAYTPSTFTPSDDLVAIYASGGSKDLYERFELERGASSTINGLGWVDLTRLPAGEKERCIAYKLAGEGTSVTLCFVDKMKQSLQTKNNGM